MPLIHEYALFLNDGHKVAEPIAASFGSTHRILLHLQPAGILIEAITGTEKLPENVLYGRDNLFADAIRKSLLFYFIRYGKSLDIDHASVFADGNQSIMYGSEANSLPLVYTMAEGNLRIGFPDRWRDSRFERVLSNTAKSSYDGRFNALHALIVAKSERYEAERLMYYWLAVNALYNYVASLKKNRISDDQYRALMRNDAKKQEELLQYYGHTRFVAAAARANRDKAEAKARDMALKVLKQIPYEAINEFCAACISEKNDNVYVDRIVAIIRQFASDTDSSHVEQFIFPFMVIWLPYKMRCDLFHASKCLPTICFRHDEEINAIRVINRLLDHFLSAELLRWFISDAESNNG